jgi:hypothetical protein
VIQYLDTHTGGRAALFLNLLAALTAGDQLTRFKGPQAAAVGREEQQSRQQQACKDTSAQGAMPVNVLRNRAQGE